MNNTLPKSAIWLYFSTAVRECHTILIGFNLCKTQAIMRDTQQEASQTDFLECLKIGFHRHKKRPLKGRF